MSNSIHLLFWGSGKMAAAIAKGLSNSKNLKLSFYSPTGESAQKLALELKGEVFDPSVYYDYVILGHKPQQLESAAAELVKSLKKDHLPTIISLLAGVRLERLNQFFPAFPVVRLMPNTPILVGEGLLGWYFGNQKSHDILTIFEACGHNIVLKSEDELDAYTAIAGSGPAYLFELARILEVQYLNLGLPPAESKAIIVGLFLGSAKLMHHSSESFEELRKNVTSKGGVTAEALKVFNDHDLENTVKMALNKNIERAHELAHPKKAKEEI